MTEYERLSLKLLSQILSGIAMVVPTIVQMGPNGESRSEIATGWLETVVKTVQDVSDAITEEGSPKEDPSE